MTVVGIGPPLTLAAQEPPAAPQRRRTLNPFGQEFMSNLFRDWPWVLGGMAVPVVLATLIALNQQPIFEAEARLLILPSNEYIFRSEIGEAGAGSALDRDQIVAAEIEILGQAEIKRQVIAELGLNRLFPGLSATQIPQAVQRFEGSLTFNTTFEASSIRISFRHPDEELAETGLSLLLKHYLERRRMVFRPPQTDFIERKATEFRDRLTLAETELRAFEQQTGMWSAGERMGTVLRQQAEARDLRDQIAQQLSAGEAQATAITRTIAAMPRSLETVVEDGERPDVEGARATLVTLEVRRQDLLTRFTEESAFVQDINRQIEALKAFVERTAPRRQEMRSVQLNAVRDDLVQRRVALLASLDGWRAQRAAVAATLETLDQQLEQVIGHGVQHQRLLRERAILEESQLFYARKLEEFSSIAEREARRDANIRLTQPPAVPARPSDRRVLIIIGGVLVGLLFGILVALIRAGLRHRFLTADEVERHFDLPVLLAVDQRPRLAPRFAHAALP